MPFSPVITSFCATLFAAFCAIPAVSILFSRVALAINAVPFNVLAAAKAAVFAASCNVSTTDMNSIYYIYIKVKIQYIFTRMFISFMFFRSAQYKLTETNTGDHSYYLGHHLSCKDSTI